MSDKETITHLKAENAGLKAKVDDLAAQNELLKRYLFGKKSERHDGQVVDPKQESLDFGDEVVDVTSEQAELKKPDLKKPKPDKPGLSKRFRLPKGMEEKRIVLTPEGVDLEKHTKIGEHTVEVLSKRPSAYFKTVYVHEVFKDEEGNILDTDYPSELPVKGCNADASVLAHVCISKYVDHTPLHRQLSALRRQGVRIAQSTFNDWVKYSYHKLNPLGPLLTERLYQAEYLLADETRMPALRKESEKKPGEEDKRKKYHEWCYYGPEAGVVVMDFQEGRRIENAAAFFDHFQGKYVQCDGYQVYDHLEKRQTDGKKVKLLGCWAHVRRKFFNALTHDKQRAEYAMRIIKLLYAIEAWATEKAMDDRQRKALRQRRAKPLLEGLHAWAVEQYTALPNKGPISRALFYMLNDWKRLIRYTEQGRFLIDNNQIENKIRPLVIGRKNFMFAGSENGGKWGALFYSLFATCAVNDINPEVWMEYVLRKINSTPEGEYEKLLPIKENFPEGKIS